MSTVPGFPDATSPTPATGLLWLTEGSGSTRDKKVEAGTLVTDLLGTAVNAQPAAATPIVPASDLLPVARGDVGGKASVNAVVEAGFAGALPGAVGALAVATALTGTETLPVVQTTAKSVLVSRLFPDVVEFSGLDDIFTGAVPTLEGSVRSQYRMTAHKMLKDVPAYADVCFHWSAKSIDAPDCGWTIPADMAALGTAFDSALRTLWGIGATAEWLFPGIQGVLHVAGGGYFPVYIWNEGGLPANSHYKIWNWTVTEEAALHTFGDLLLHIPGRPIP